MRIIIWGVSLVLMALIAESAGASIDPTNVGLQQYEFVVLPPKEPTVEEEESFHRQEEMDRLFDLILEADKVPLPIPRPLNIDALAPSGHILEIKIPMPSERPFGAH